MEFQSIDRTAKVPSIADLSIPEQSPWHQKVSQLFREKKKTYIRAANEITHDLTRAEDAVQTAMIGLLGSEDRFRGDAELSTYTYKIVRNCALNCSRGDGRYQARVTTVPPETLDLHPLANPSECYRSPEKLAEKSELCRSVSTAIATISAPSREGAESFLRGESPKEMSDALDMKHGTAKSRQYRARTELAEPLRNYSDYLD